MWRETSAGVTSLPPCPGRHRRRHHDGQLPVQGVVVEQRGIHQTAVPVAGQPVPGPVQGTHPVHGRVRLHQCPVPERVQRLAERVRTYLMPTPIP